MIDCCGNFFGDPEASETRQASRRERYGINDQLWKPPVEGFYTTDWFAENSVRMIRDHSTEKSFFL